MKHCEETAPELAPDSKPGTQLHRRHLFVGAAAVGALGAVAAATKLTPTLAVPAQAAAAQSESAGGYQLTDHVKQYYASARV